MDPSVLKAWRFWIGGGMMADWFSSSLLSLDFRRFLMAFRGLFGFSGHGGRVCHGIPTDFVYWCKIF